MSTVQEKIDLLHHIVQDDESLVLVLDKFLLVVLEQYRRELARYEADLTQFEQRFGMASDEFYQKFNQGLLGDEMDFFEWYGLVELHHDLQEKIDRVVPRACPICRRVK